MCRLSTLDRHRICNHSPFYYNSTSTPKYIYNTLYNFLHKYKSITPQLSHILNWAYLLRLWPIAISTDPFNLRHLSLACDLVFTKSKKYSSQLNHTLSSSTHPSKYRVSRIVSLNRKSGQAQGHRRFADTGAQRTSKDTQTSASQLILPSQKKRHMNDKCT